jgi:hypothetical protein
MRKTMNVFNKFFNIFTGNIQQPLSKIVSWFLLTNIILYIILAIPIWFIVLSLFPSDEAEGILLPLITPLYISPVLALISGIRVFNASETKSRKIMTILIFFLPISILLIQLITIYI